MTFQFPYAQHQGPEVGCFKNLPTSCLRYQGGHFPMELGIVQLSYQLPNCQNAIKVNLQRLLRNTLLYNHCLFVIQNCWGNRFQVLQIFFTALDFTVSYTLHKLSTDTNIFRVHADWNYLQHPHIHYIWHLSALTSHFRHTTVVSEWTVETHRTS